MSIGYTVKKNGVPDWVNGCNVGDDITFINPLDGEEMTEKIVGFSTVPKNLGRPVIRGNTIDGVKAHTIAITEEHYVG